MSMGYRSRRFLIAKLISIIWSVAVIVLSATGILMTASGGNLWVVILIALILVLMGSAVAYVGAVVLAGSDSGS
jgi:hypothetical protein